MVHYSVPLACFSYFLLLSHIPGSSSDYCKLQEYYIIRNERSGLVLEANDVTRAVTIETHTGNSSQLWAIEDGNKPGVFYIINKRNGKLLDVGQENRIEVNVRNDASSQQWFMELGGVFPNVQYEKMLDVVGGKYEPGNPLQVWERNGDPAQKFLLQKADS